MDIKRDPPKKTKKYIAWGVGLVGIVAVSIGISKLKPAAPSVDSATQWIDSVSRGELVRAVSAPGTLVPERVIIVAAVTAGRVEALPIRPPATVGPNTPIVVLSNADVELQALQSQQSLTAAISSLASLRTTFRENLLSQQGVVATTNTAYQDAMRNRSVMDSLALKDLASDNEIQKARDLARELKTRLDLETQRMGEIQSAEKVQVQLMEEQVAGLRQIVQAQRDRVNSMRVVAGESGVLQTLPLELGQWVNPGLELARVAQPGKLKAVLRVQESQAKDVALGQTAKIDTRNGIVEGHVMRIDPSVQGGTVTVEVALDGPLPQGARADLSVDGTIEIDRLKDVMYVGRPAFGQPNSTIGMFKLDPDGKGATLVNVKLGRASVQQIEVVSGLNVGDRVIISDISQFNDVTRIRLK